MSFFFFELTTRKWLMDAFRVGLPAPGSWKGKRAFGKGIITFASLGLFFGVSGLPSTRGASADRAKPVEAAAGSFLDQIVAELHGVSIAEAKPADLAAAVRKVVAKNPKQAAEIVAEVLAVERPDMNRVAGLVVAAAIKGVGPDITEATLNSIVRVAVELRRSDLLTIVSCSARAVSSCEMVALIVKTAAEPSSASDGKEIVPVDNKNVVPQEGKEVVPLDGKGIVPLQSDNKNVVPTDGKQADDASEIARTAFEARPDCFTKTLDVTSIQTFPTPIPILPQPTASPVSTPAPSPPVASAFQGVIKSPAYIDPFPVVPSR